MSNYSKITDYAAKDLLLHADPAKAIKGTEVGAEFDAIATMSATKGDKSGTLAQFAATTSSQLAGVISDETGSGALVFATSPTLVTPALGTPASGTLTSCTGLPASSVVNTPAGTIAATDIQAAINELDTEKAALAGSASQTFSVAAATAAAHAVRADGVMGRNKIINGRFQINQRGYVSAATLAAGNYGHDRFKAGASGGDYSFTQNAADTTITIASGKSLIQVIEDVNVSDTAYVLSWTGSAQARYAVNSATPTGSYAASPILITGQTVGTVMSVEFNTGTVGDIQLEAGAIATPFEHRHYGTELALCQRYLPSISVYSSGIMGQCVSGTTASIYAKFPVLSRVAPTGVSLISGGTWYITNAVGSAQNLTSATFLASNQYGGSVTATTSGAVVAGNATSMWSNTAGDAVLLTGCEL